jgi:excisionase family DNA binding protein
MKSPPRIEHSFYSLRQLAARWQISVKSLRRYIARGELPYHRFGRQLRISVQDALAFERARREHHVNVTAGEHMGRGIREWQ